MFLFWGRVSGFGFEDGRGGARSVRGGHGENRNYGSARGAYLRRHRVVLLAAVQRCLCRTSRDTGYSLSKGTEEQQTSEIG